jgi:hypothetical protein
MLPWHGHYTYGLCPPAPPLPFKGPIPFVWNPVPSTGLMAMRTLGGHFAPTGFFPVMASHPPEGGMLAMQAAIALRETAAAPTAPPTAPAGVPEDARGDYKRTASAAAVKPAATVPRQRKKKKLVGDLTDDARALLAESKCLAEAERPPKRLWPCCWTGCATVCRTANDLQLHVRQHHTGQAVFPCSEPGCDILFISAAALSVHMVTHTKVKAFACQHAGCGRPFATKSTLLRHQVTHDPALRLACSVCGRTFAQTTSLSSHMATQHTKDCPYACRFPGCPMTHPTMAALRAHVVNCHL